MNDDKPCQGMFSNVDCKNGKKTDYSTWKSEYPAG